MHSGGCQTIRIMELHKNLRRFVTKLTVEYSYCGMHPKEQGQIGASPQWLRWWIVARKECKAYIIHQIMCDMCLGLK